MALSVLNNEQTTGVATTLTITSAEAGNYLVAFVSGSVIGTITGADNISGSTGWTTNSTTANNGTVSMAVAYKLAVGGETTLEPTQSGGSVQGIAYFEVAGNNSIAPIIDVIVATNGSSPATTLASSSVTTTYANDIILADVGAANTGLTMGAPTAWTSYVLTNITTSSSNTVGGSIIPGATVSGKTPTGNWTTSRLPAGMIVIALAPISGINLAWTV
ncbi:MAG TPA: hypothetical protein VMR34_01160 [Candidatus Saccharimonadales bacterium]|nr:hypothetical protein [Candidatus Saccharimonadales bacterium]